MRRGDGGMPMTSRTAVATARTALLSLQSSGLTKPPGGIVDSVQHLYGGDFGRAVPADGRVCGEAPTTPNAPPPEGSSRRRERSA